MKRIKYTNTHVMPLVTLSTFEGFYLYSLEIKIDFYIKKVRNHSKNQSALTYVSFNDFDVILEMNPDSAMTLISNVYLLEVLLAQERMTLVKKLFGCAFPTFIYVSLPIYFYISGRVEKSKKEGKIKCVNDQK